MDDRSPPSTGLVAADSGRSGPYSPQRDPTIIVLSLIVVGSFLLLVTGTGASLVGGSGGGPVFPLADDEDRDESTTVELSLDANRTTLTANGSVSVTVTDADGDPIEGATVGDGDRTVETDADGTATLRFERAGSVTLRADKADGEATEYRAATLELVVERRPVSLDAATNASTAAVDEPVAVTVTRADTGAPVSGELTVGNRTIPVTEGRANVSFDAAGEYTVTATRSETATERFREASTTVTVERLDRDLVVDLFRSEILVGRGTLLQVRRADTGEGVAAAVTVGNRTLETGATGYATVWDLPAGEYDVRATAPSTPRVAFREGAATLSVERDSVDLAVTADATTPEGGENVTIRVTRADTGAPVDASVSVDGDAYRTGEDGRVTVAFDRPGNRTFVATKADTRATTFREGATTISVRAPWFAVDASLDAASALDEEYGVNATVRNVGNEPGETTVTYRLIGQKLAERTVSLAPGESVTVSFGPYLPPLLAGTYGQSVTVATDGATGLLTVHAGNATGRAAVRADTAAEPSAEPVETRRRRADPATLEYGLRAADKRYNTFYRPRKTS